MNTEESGGTGAESNHAFRGHRYSVDAIGGVWQRFMPFRFLVVGAWNFAFSYGVFAVLYYLLSQAFANWVIVVIASVIGITNSFITHRVLTYKSTGVWWVEYLKFYVVYGWQSVLFLLGVHVFVTVLACNAYVVSFVINLVLTIFSYWAHKYFSFRKQTEGRQEGSWVL